MGYLWMYSENGGATLAREIVNTAGNPELLELAQHYIAHFIKVCIIGPPWWIIFLQYSQSGVRVGRHQLREAYPGSASHAEFQGIWLSVAKSDGLRK